VEGLEYHTIADILSIGMSAVKMRIHRARLAFRQVFVRICREFLPIE
jgi:DNA-directed RNA polymerase specialized sigma24 family protein